jgi:hypothetical protein
MMRAHLPRLSSEYWRCACGVSSSATNAHSDERERGGKTAPAVRVWVVRSRPLGQERVSIVLSSRVSPIIRNCPVTTSYPHVNAGPRRHDMDDQKFQRRASLRAPRGGAARTAASRVRNKALAATVSAVGWRVLCRSLRAPIERPPNLGGSEPVVLELMLRTEGRCV